LTCEDLERFDQSAGTILNGKRDRDFIGGRIGPNTLPAADQKESGEIGWVVLDAGSQNLSTILPRSLEAGDGGGGGISGLDHLLDAAGGVIERRGPDFGMLLKEAAALSEGDWMRRRPLDCFDMRAGQSDQVVADAKERFALDGHVLIEEKIVVLCDRAGERILYRNHSRVDRSIDNSLEDLRGDRTRNDGCDVVEMECGSHAQRGLVAERT